MSQSDAQVERIAKAVAAIETDFKEGRIDDSQRRLALAEVQSV